MTVYLAWTDAELSGALSDALPDTLPGPWREVRVGAPGLLLVDSDDTLSRVYHELKWSLPDGSPLLVAPLGGRPKLKGLAAGTTTWLRERT